MNSIARFNRLTVQVEGILNNIPKSHSPAVPTKHKKDSSLSRVALPNCQSSALGQD